MIFKAHKFGDYVDVVKVKLKLHILRDSKEVKQDLGEAWGGKK